MHTREAIEKALVDAFPGRVVEGRVAPHDCDECSALSISLAGLTWHAVPRDVVRSHEDVLPLLSPEAHAALLPAWLREGLWNPRGTVAGMLMVHLGSAPETYRFTQGQRDVIVALAHFIAANDGFGTGDPVNQEHMSEIQRVWSA